jgi:spoIIIJ-associated protein
MEGDETVLTLRSQGVQSWLRQDARMADALSHLAQRAAQKLIGPEASARVDVPGAAREDGRREGRSRERGDRESDDALEAMAREIAEEVSKTGEPKLLRPMNSKERWVVHNAIKDMQGLRSQSIGDGRQRRVKIEPE